MIFSLSTWDSLESSGLSTLGPIGWHSFRVGMPGSPRVCRICNRCGVAKLSASSRVLCWGKIGRIVPLIFPLFQPLLLSLVEEYCSPLISDRASSLFFPAFERSPVRLSHFEESCNSLNYTSYRELFLPAERLALSRGDGQELGSPLIRSARESSGDVASVASAISITCLHSVVTALSNSLQLNDSSRHLDWYSPINRASSSRAAPAGTENSPGHTA